MFKNIIFLICLSGFALAQSFSPAFKFRQALEQKSECKELVSIFWSELHQLVIDQNLDDVSWPNLRKSLMESNNTQVQKLDTWLKILEVHLGPQFWKKPSFMQAEILAQLEMGIDINNRYVGILKAFSKLRESIEIQNVKTCLPVQSRNSKFTSELSLGARKIMSIAYQSCEATKLSVLDRQSSNMQGVSIIGNHVDKVGKVRKISNLNQVQMTHPYLRIQNKEMGCFPVMNQPLIYDYGGKPSYQSASGNEINLFKNAGSGGAALGIDCSALVVASLGIEGLRLNPNEDMTARNTAAFGTATLIQSPDYFSCLDYVNIGAQQKPLIEGDIVTVPGHVVIVDEVGSDPFGVSGITSTNACNQLTIERFDFRIIHSSPAWGSVGISRVEARDYLKSASKMRAGLLKYAKNHCVAQIKNQVIKPRYSDISVVRHKKTSECLGRELKISGQECVKSCL